MKNVNKRIYSFLMALSLILVMIIPVYASSSHWSISDFLYRYLNGGDNGIYYSFDKGDSISIDGYLNYYAGSQLASPNPSDITVVLYREKWGSDKKIGSFTISSPDGNGNVWLSKDFSGYFGTADASSSRYYLVFFKDSGIDYWEVSGSGELSD